MARAGKMYQASCHISKFLHRRLGITLKGVTPESGGGEFVNCLRYRFLYSGVAWCHILLFLKNTEAS